jgi:hypothetical protein
VSSGEIAVVIRVHAPDPYRPRVRVVIGADGTKLEVPYDRNLFEPRPDTGARDDIAAPLDPAHFQIDPLMFLDTR